MGRKDKLRSRPPSSMSLPILSSSASARSRGEACSETKGQRCTSAVFQLICTRRDEAKFQTRFPFGPIQLYSIILPQ